MTSSVAAIIVAAGDSRRLPGAELKQWRLLGGQPLVLYALRFFDEHPAVDQIVVAVDDESLRRPDRLRLLESRHGKPVRATPGGSFRQQTVWLALQTLQGEPELVLIHDAARPFPSAEGVEMCLSAAREVGGAILALPVAETIKRATGNGEVARTIDRDSLWAAQTPQVFCYRRLMAAYQVFETELERFTDDAGIFEAHGGRVRLVMGTDANFKITTPEDFARAERRIADCGLRIAECTMRNDGL